MVFKRFDDIRFHGHDDCLDYSYARFPADKLDDVLKVVNDLGWRIVRAGVRSEYDGKYVIAVDTDRISTPIEGYRGSEPVVEYAILRRYDDDKFWNVTFSTAGRIEPFSEQSFDVFKKCVKYAYVPLILPDNER